MLQSDSIQTLNPRIKNKVIYHWSEKTNHYLPDCMERCVGSILGPKIVEKYSFTSSQNVLIPFILKNHFDTVIQIDFVLHGIQHYDIKHCYSVHRNQHDDTTPCHSGHQPQHNDTKHYYSGHQNQHNDTKPYHSGYQNQHNTPSLVTQDTKISIMTPSLVTQDTKIT